MSNESWYWYTSVYIAADKLCSSGAKTILETIPRQAAKPAGIM